MTTNPDLTAEMPSGVDTAPVRAPEIALFGAPGAPDREAAWGSFVARHTPMLLRIARAVTQDHDAAMEAYAFVLGQLREHDFRRLLAYQITESIIRQAGLEDSD